MSSPAAGDQTYVFPAIAVEPINSDGFAQVNVLSIPAFATGGAIFCAMITSSVEVQPLALDVTVRL